MKLFDKCHLSEFEASRVETTPDGFIIITLGPYTNTRSMHKDARRIINNWRDHNKKERLPTPDASGKNFLCRWFLRKFFGWR
jgi:hypothetical protein